MLGFGLILIDWVKNKVDVVLDPSEYKPRKVKQKKDRLLGEFQSRVGDPNLGGMASKKGVLTSYRQKALKVALYLEEHGDCKASAIAKDKARDIMYNDYYSWFHRVGKGIYSLTSKGKEEIGLWLERES
jgi:hypothetical protein